MIVEEGVPIGIVLFKRLPGEYARIRLVDCANAVMLLPEHSFSTPEGSMFTVARDIMHS